MSDAPFLRRREDRTFSVSSRFVLEDSALKDVVDDYIATWVHRKTHENHIDLLKDLAVLPWTEIAQDGFIDIVFDGKPDSRRWKDWMVYLTRDLASSITRVTFYCFYDRVQQAPHPASLKRRL
jgi:hypothetical protein